MGVIGDILGGSSETTSTVTLSAEQRELVAKQVELADFQLQELQNQRELQETAFTGAEAAAGDFDQFVDQAGGEDSASAQSQLLQDQLARIQAGGAATDEEIRLINEATERALAAGETDITRFLEQGLETLRDELAPQLGLRPGDTPILDRGARGVAEASRQQGQLVNSLRGQQALSQLNFPLQRTATLGTLSLGQQELGQNVQQFQAGLRQSAFLNRLQLGGARSTAGLGLASVSAPNVGAALGNVGQTSTTSGSPGLGSILGGAGGLLLGLGSIGLGASTGGATIAGGTTFL